jgi:predicted RNA-binding protein YlxR (DUF448 family)
MLARAEHDDLDAGPRPAGPRGAVPERLCVATRQVKPTSEMIRFVVGPDGAVVPDVKHKLPGRGVWVTARRGAVAEALARKAFARSFRRDVKAAPDLVATTEDLLVRAALDALAIAHKAGRVAVGFAKAEAALTSGAAIALIHAADASPDGVRKLAAAACRQSGRPENRPAVIDMFTSPQLDLALGRSNVVHAAVLAGPASIGFLVRCRTLERFRGEDRSA